ncbi:aminopeptidase N-like [Temnothorax curvispinosus]|uniref:Aminopeptidase n=1 Tax=Temnothorax curvispinosus TaxID=300111 RepID=A0A6J1Q8I9_9HYME|nr:aminopeptidase N-like [Temnothorax curvispinosus]
MAIVKSLLTVILLFVVSQGVPLQDNEAADNKPVENSEENQFRLPKYVVPIHYNVKLIPHIVDGNFTTNGETSIDIEVREPTNAIALHTVKLTIDESLTKITRKGVDDENSKSEYAPKQHEYNGQTQILTLRFEESLDVGAYTLHINFTGVILPHTEPRGFYRSFYTDDNGTEVWLATTHFQPTSARQAFPCWDEPAIKATFKFSIKHYPNYTALSNMPSTRSEIDAVDGKLWTHFEATPIMSTNLLGFVIADYDYISNLDGTIKIWAPKHLLPYVAHSLDIIEKATQKLEEFTNSTVRVPKMDHVSIPHYSSRATENWGVIVYKQGILENKNSYPISNKIGDVMTITHELAHQWFGNLVSPIWWKYLWLSEGISTYLKYYITDKFLREKRLMDFIVVTEEESLLNIALFSSEPIHINITSHLNVRDVYSINTYVKAAFLLRMASHFLREDVFRNGLIRYLQKHEYSSATPDDLWEALQDALDESDVPHDDFKVKEVMDTWFDQARYPLVTVNRDYATGEIKISQEIIKHQTIDNNENEAWWIPLNFATQSNLDFSSTLATHWLKPHDVDVKIEGIDTNDWIIVNKHLTGFYRVNYDINNWKRIAAFLNSDNYDKIPVLNRVQIFNDAYYMMMNERLDLATFIEIIKYLSRETDAAPWYTAFNIIQKLDHYLRLPEAATIIKPHLSNLMHKLLENIDFEENPDDDLLTAKIRTNLYHYVCTFEPVKCPAKITAKLLAYVENPIANRPLPNQKSMFCFGLMKANESVWDQFLQVEHQQKTSESHTFLGCSENLHIIEKHLNSLSGDMDYHRIFYNIIANLPNVDTTIEFFINNYEKFIEHQFINISFLLEDIIMKSFREGQINKIKAFAEQHMIDIQKHLQAREEMLVKMKDNLSKVHSILENRQSTDL